MLGGPIRRSTLSSKQRENIKKRKDFLCKGTFWRSYTVFSFLLLNLENKEVRFLVEIFFLCSKDDIEGLIGNSRSFKIFAVENFAVALHFIDVEFYGKH